jgi:hypothetical protein
LKWIIPAGGDERKGFSGKDGTDASLRLPCGDAKVPPYFRRRESKDMSREHAE